MNGVSEHLCCHASKGEFIKCRVYMRGLEQCGESFLEAAAATCDHPTIVNWCALDAFFSFFLFFQA